MPKFLHINDRQYQQQFSSMKNSHFNPYSSHLNNSTVDGYNPVHFLQRAKQLKQLNIGSGHEQQNYKNKNLNHPGYKKRPPHDVYEQDIQCVYQGRNGIGKIFIGNLEAAQNIQTLKKHNIGAVLTACKGIYIDHPKTHIQHYLYIPGEDHQRYDISVHFDQAVSFIKKSTEQTNILVHCMAGISRSVSLVLAYLMKEKGMNYNQAYSIVKKNRKIINPNPGFIKQLQRFQKQLQRELHSRNRSIQQFQRFKGDHKLENSRNAFSPLHYGRAYRNQYTNPQTMYRRSKMHNQNFHKSQADIKLTNQKSIPLNSSTAYNSSKKFIDQGISYNFTGNMERPTTHYQKNYFFLNNDINNKDECNDFRNYEKPEPSNQNNKTVNFDKYQTKLNSYNDLNRQIDQKIKNIRDKYTQYTIEMIQNNKYTHNYNATTNLRHTMPVNKKEDNQMSRSFLTNQRNAFMKYQTTKNNLNLRSYKYPQKESQQNQCSFQNRKNRNYEDLEYDYPKRRANGNLWATDRLKEMFSYQRHPVN